MVCLDKYTVMGKQTIYMRSWFLTGLKHIWITLLSIWEKGKDMIFYKSSGIRNP